MVVNHNLWLLESVKNINILKSENQNMTSETHGEWLA